MNKKQLLVLDVLLAFLAFTFYALYHDGLNAFFPLVFANATTSLVFTDLFIALVMVNVWLWFDARSRNISPSHSACTSSDSTSISS